MRSDEPASQVRLPAVARFQGSARVKHLLCSHQSRELGEAPATAKVPQPGKVELDRSHSQAGLGGNLLLGVAPKQLGQDPSFDRSEVVHAVL